MHEITWGGKGLPENGHPWTLSDWLFDRDNFDFGKSDWRQHPYFDGNACVKDLDRISAAFDQLLMGHGYRHEGVRFWCNAEQEETFALFSHGGSGACVLSHLLALPFPYLCTVMPYDFTSIIILSFPVRPGEYVHPRIELFNDAAHIRNIRSGICFQKDPDAK